jgi:hypothetical protein
VAEVASAYVALLPSMANFGKKLDSQMSPQLAKSGKSGGKIFGGAFKAIAGPALALVGTAAIGGFLKDSIGEAREAQKVGAQTEAVIKSTGKAAGLSAKKFGDLATSISLKTGIDDEAIQSGENMLATFTNIKDAAGKNNDIFSQATKVATDMGVATKSGPVQASLLLGKALNDPAKGMSRLTKIGVTFTDQQKAQVEQMVKAGDTAGAQRVILKELGKEFGGSAAAQATAGDKAAVAIGNLKEVLGTALLPVVDRVATVTTTKIIPAISGFITGMQSGAGAGGRLASILGATGAVISKVFGFIKNNAVVLSAFVGTIVVLVGVIKVWTAVQTLLNVTLVANPIGLIVVAIAALVAGVIVAYTKFASFRAVVDSTFAAIRSAVDVAMPYVKSVIQGATDQILGIVKVFKGVFTGNWSQVWDGIKQILRGALTLVKTLLKAQLAIVVGLVQNIGPLLLSAASAAFGVLKAGAQAGWAKAKEYVKGIPGKVTDAFSGAKTLLSDIGGFMVDGLKNGLEASWHKVTDFVDKGIKLIPKKIRNLMGIKSPSKVTTKLGQYIGQGLVNGLRDGSSGVDAYLTEITKKITGSLSLKKTTPGMSKKQRAAVSRYNDTARDAVKSQKAAVDALGKSLAGLAGKIDTARGQLQSLRDERASLAGQTASSISGELDLTTTPNGKKLSFATVAANVSGLASRAKAFAGKLRALLAAGIPAGLVQEVASLGTATGMGVADALLSGTSQQVGQLASDYAGLDTYSKQVGDVVAGGMFDAGIRAQEGILKGLLDDKSIQIAANQLAAKLSTAVKKALGANDPQAAIAGKVNKLKSSTKVKVKTGYLDTGSKSSASVAPQFNVYPQPGQSEEEIGRAAANRLAWAMS